jgi:hypothetical protein
MPVHANNYVFPSGEEELYAGLTFRQWAATQIMAGLAADDSPYTPEDAAVVAVDWADSLIKELNKPKGG